MAEGNFIGDAVGHGMRARHWQGFRDEMLSDVAKRRAAEAIWAEIDGPLGRASTDPTWKALSGMEQDQARFEVGVLAAIEALA